MHWLGDVVVGSCPERAHLGLDVAHGADEHDWRVCLGAFGLPNADDDVKPVDIRKLGVERDQVGPIVAPAAQSPGPVVGDEDLVPIAPERVAQLKLNGRLRSDDENAGYISPVSVVCWLCVGC
jgi:hypothetical protein